MDYNKEDLEKIETEDLSEVKELDEIEDVEDIEDDNSQKKETSKKSRLKQPKKKLGKGAKIGIGIGSVVAVIAIVVIVAVSVLMAPSSGNNGGVPASKGLLFINGFQQPTNVADINLRDGATGIVSVNTMLTTEGLSIDNEADIPTIASYMYNLAVTNYAKIDGTAWYCLTDSSVSAKNVKAKLAIFSLSVDSFAVDVRAAYAEGTTESKTVKDARGNYVNNFFSQTISGVTGLHLEGISDELTDKLKNIFGYNIQLLRYDNIYAYRRGNNGGAKFYDETMIESKPDCAKYLMGAYNASFPTKTTKVKHDPKAFYIHEYDEKTDTAATELDYISKPDDVILSREYAWSPLNTYYEYAYKLAPYEVEENYYYGNYGCGWAVYDFSVANIDSTTTIEYNADTDVYTINLVVKEDKADKACMFAKGSLVKDTKDYIQMQDAKYSLSKNIIEIYGNGLIKSWDRVEKVESDKQAKLTALSGECYGGGATENATYQSFSYSELDYNPLRLVSIYWPELGQSSVVGEYAFDLSNYPTFETYVPILNN